MCYRMRGRVGVESAEEIIGYDTPEPVCPDCLPAWLGKEGAEVPAERLLDSLAAQKRIDRDDLSSYDSDDLPKPIFASQETDGERCSGICGRVLGED